MKIVYLIGNGFDLRLGFKTSYLDFLEAYKKSGAPIEVEAWKKLFFERLEEKGDDWSDLELALGEFTADFKQNEEGVKAFKQFYFDLQRALIIYLKQQGELGNIPYSELSKFINDLYSPWQYLRSNQQRKRLLGGSIIDRTTISINIISFNYTNYCEQMCSFSPGHSRLVGDVLIHFIHRRLEDRGVLFGLDSIDQIANEYFRKHRRVKEWLVKPHCSKEACEDEVMEVCEEKIKEADLICIFGSSMGATDKTWWRAVGERVEAGVPLIRFIYKPELVQVFDHLLPEYEEQYRQETLNILGITTTEEEYRGRIFVPINSEMFPKGKA